MQVMALLGFRWCEQYVAKSTGSAKNQCSAIFLEDVRFFRLLLSHSPLMNFMICWYTCGVSVIMYMMALG